MLRHAVRTAVGGQAQKPSALFRQSRRFLCEQTAAESRDTERVHPERKYVRMAGVTAYASRDDILHFMQRNGVDTSELTSQRDARFPIAALAWDSRKAEELAQASTEGAPVEEISMPALDTNYSPRIPLLSQAQNDTFMNHAIWMYDAGSASAADEVASRLGGKVCGLKLVRTSTVDSRIVRELLGVPSAARTDEKRGTLRRRRINSIAPLPHEYDRSLLLTALPRGSGIRSLWAFFGSYDVGAIRLLRKDQVASVVFRSVDEARRALRERGNLALHDTGRLNIRLHP